MNIFYKIFLAILEPIFISKEGKSVGVAVAVLMLVTAVLSFFLYLIGIVSDVFVIIVIGVGFFLAGIIVVVVNISLTKLEKRIENGDLSPPGRFDKIFYGAMLGAIVGVVGLFLISHVLF